LESGRRVGLAAQRVNNYCIVRASALEDNVVLYEVENSELLDLGLKGEDRTYGKKMKVPLEQPGYCAVSSWISVRTTH
jgi:hypothetical protein